MDFNLTQDQKMIRDMLRDFTEEKIKPLAEETDKESKFPQEIVKELGKLGIMGINIPPEYGGSGADGVSYAIAVEEISRGCASTGIIVSVNNSLACYPLLAYGTEEQKKKYLTPLASGQKLGSFGLTEPDAGSDVASGKTTAKKEGDKYILNGNKRFITNAGESDIYIVFGATDPEKGAKGMSTFVLEKDTPGFTFGRLEDKLGIKGSATRELIFENVEIPQDQLISEEGKGMKIALSTLDVGRIGVAAQAVGIAQAALEYSVNYSKERVQFGKPISSFQAIQWMLADMATEIDAARLLTYKAAALKDSGARFSKEAAMAKLFASEAAMRATIKAVQIHGGYGYSKEYPVERLMRDAKITEIYEGTSEVMRMVIAASLLR